MLPRIIRIVAWSTALLATVLASRAIVPLLDLPWFIPRRLAIAVPGALVLWLDLLVEYRRTRDGSTPSTWSSDIVIVFLLVLGVGKLLTRLFGL